MARFSSIFFPILAAFSRELTHKPSVPTAVCRGCVFFTLAFSSISRYSATALGDDLVLGQPHFLGVRSPIAGTVPFYGIRLGSRAAEFVAHFGVRTSLYMPFPVGNGCGHPHDDSSKSSRPLGLFVLTIKTANGACAGPFGPFRFFRSAAFGAFSLRLLLSMPGLFPCLSG